MRWGAGSIGRIAALFLFSAALVFAQEHGGKEASGGTPEVSIGWKWANFAILMFGLGFLVRKHAPPFFAGRSEEIRKELESAAAAQRDAEARVAAIEARLQNLEGEISAVRAKAREALAQEGERIRRDTDSAIAHMDAHVRSEIAVATKTARAEVKAYAAELALQGAEAKLRDRLSKESDRGLIRGFVEGLN